eukprot:8338410-Alexandrium_andersonii.AAC.1
MPGCIHGRVRQRGVEEHDCEHPTASAKMPSFDAYGNASVDEHGCEHPTASVNVPSSDVPGNAGAGEHGCEHPTAN